VPGSMTKRTIEDLDETRERERENHLNYKIERLSFNQIIYTKNSRFISNAMRLILLLTLFVLELNKRETYICIKLITLMDRESL
jgi:hypothetical protein